MTLCSCFKHSHCRLISNIKYYMHPFLSKFLKIDNIIIVYLIVYNYIFATCIVKFQLLTLGRSLCALHLYAPIQFGAFEITPFHVNSFQFQRNIHSRVQTYRCIYGCEIIKIATRSFYRFEHQLSVSSVCT